MEYPAVEPVSDVEAVNYLRAAAADTDLIHGLIVAAREQCEVFTGRILARRKFAQALDSFPYYTDTIQSQLAMPPSYYSLPRYSTTLWNYSQMIKLGAAPLIDVFDITYIDANGVTQKLNPGIDFVGDWLSEPPRLFPLPGSFWPAGYYTPNQVVVHFEAGYDPDPHKVLELNVDASPEESPDEGEDVSITLPNPPKQQESYQLGIGIPLTLKTAILQLVAHWYFNREPVVQGQPGTLPFHVESMLWSHKVLDVAPTRG
jgi:hypothetical protein